MQKIRKGKFEVPATVKIKKVLPYTECDFTMVYAYATELKRMAGAKSKITEIKTKKNLDDSDDFDEPHFTRMDNVLDEISKRLDN